MLKTARLALAAAALAISALAHAATCSVTEFASAGTVVYQAALAPALVQQSPITIGSSTASAAFNGGTTLVRIECSASAYASFGATPTATSSSMQIPAGVPEYFAVPLNSGLKVAFLTGP